jgi:HlyD family secretion protein
MSDPVKSFGIARRIWIASIMVVGMVGGCAAWSVTAELSGAIIAAGSVIVEHRVKRVQHREGGIVAAILVKDGDGVKAGQPLIHLDDTQVRAELGIVRSQLVALTGRKARLEAERDGSRTIEFPSSFQDLGQEAAAVRQSELRLFGEAVKSRDSQREQLESRILQLKEEISGLTTQREARAYEVSLIRKELEQVEILQQKQLTPISRVYSMEREAARLTGDVGQLTSQIAKASGQIAELRLQILAIDQTVRTEAQREISQIEARLAELGERQIAAHDRLARMEVKAPYSGIVQELAVHSVGGVITPAEPLMVIVPENDALAIEVKVAPTDIDQVKVEQPVRLRFTGYNQKTTPEQLGHVSNVSADITRDSKNGQSYYTAQIQLDRGLSEMTEKFKLMPGMPVEAFIATQHRTAFTYLFKPLTDQFARAFKED